MNVSRRTFLGTTSAFTSINLYTPEASAPIEDPNPWRAVWCRPQQPKPSFALDPETKRLLAKATGKAYRGEQTVRIIPDKPAEFNPATGEGVYRHKSNGTLG